MENKIRVMLVENMPFEGEVMKDSLLKSGYEVDGPFVTAEDAMNFLRKDNPTPDVALLDIELDGKLDGIDLAHRLTEYCNCGIVFLSGKTDDNIRKRIKGVDCIFYSKTDGIISEISLTDAIERQTEKSKSVKSQNMSSKIASSPLPLLLYRGSMAFLVNVHDIILLQADSEAANVTVLDEKDQIKTYLSRNSLQDVQALVAKHGDFRQIHRSTIVNMDFVKSINHKENTLAFKVSIDPAKIGRAYKSNLDGYQKL